MALLGLLVAGCSAVPAYVTPPPPHNYRQIVADSLLATKLHSKPSFGPLEIAGLQKTVLGEPGDWRTCLRTMKSGQPVYFAVFFVGEEIVGRRRSVGIDHCEQETQFVMLPPPQPKSKTLAAKRR